MRTLTLLLLLGCGEGAFDTADTADTSTDLDTGLSPEGVATISGDPGGTPGCSALGTSGTGAWLAPLVLVLTRRRQGQAV